MPTNGSVARMSTPPARSVQSTARQCWRTSHQTSSTASVGRTEMAIAAAIEPIGRSRPRHTKASATTTRMLTLPSERSTSTGWLKAATANTSSLTVGRTGITAQARASSPTRSTNQAMVAAWRLMDVSGSTPTASGGAYM